MVRLAALVVVSAFVAATALAFAGISETVPTRLGLSRTTPYFHGKVKTDVPDCESNRRVKLFFQLQKGRGVPPGGRQLVGRTDSDRQGKWYIDATPLRDGAYFAKAKQHIVNVDGVLVRCEPAFSRTLTSD